MSVGCSRPGRVARVSGVGWLEQEGGRSRTEDGSWGLEINQSVQRLPLAQQGLDLS